MDSLDIFGNPLPSGDEEDHAAVEVEESGGRTVYVHFESEEDVQGFADAIGKPITPLTKKLRYQGR